MSRNNASVPRIVAAAGWLLFAVFASAQRGNDLELSLSPSPVGSGARAAGMADAFVAIADDATAANWNPAGLIQLELPEMSIVGSWNQVNEQFDVDFHDETNTSNSADNFDLNYMSFVYPLPLLVLNRNVTVALNYQRKYDFTRDFSFVHNGFTPLRGGLRIHQDTAFAFEQEGGLSTITPAVAFEITPRISLGLSLNIWRSTFFSDNSWTQDISQDTMLTSFRPGGISTAFVNSRVTEEYEDFSGENLVIGLLWTPSDRWSFAARYDTAFTGDVDYYRQSLQLRSGLPPALFPTRPSYSAVKERRKISFPDTLAFGVAHRVNDRLTFSLDVTTTDWDDFVMRQENGRRTSLINGASQSNAFTYTDFKRTKTIRFGTEYVFIPKQPDEKLERLWSLRGGVFYDEEPATREPDKFYGVAAGAGLLLQQRVNIDLAYQYRWGDGVNEDFVRGIDNFQEDVGQHRLLLSTVIYLGGRR